MIRCSGFCLSLDRKHTREAAFAAERIERMRKGEPKSLVLGRWEALFLPLETVDGLPVVHGWRSPDDRYLEASAIERRNGEAVCSRDPAGTRPLYLAKSGSWLASDHRFFPREERVMLPPGSTYLISSGRVLTRGQRKDRFRGTYEEAGLVLAGLIQDIVRERVKGRKAAVAFSGGLDSSILAWCAKKHSRVVAITIGSRGSRDSTEAPRAAEALGVEHLHIEIDKRIVKNELLAMDLPFEATSMDRSLWCIYSLASMKAAEAGAELVMLGQLADELFGGYMKYERALVRSGEAEAIELMQKDVAMCGTRGFIRDEAACARWTEPRFPFSDRRVMDFGLRLPVSFKIRGGSRKAILREAAKNLGVPEEICGAPKKAAQYSSGVLKLID